MAGLGGGYPSEAAEELRERLQYPPGEAARIEVNPTPDGPRLSRWTLRGIRASMEWLNEYSLSGVWRVLQAADIQLRQGRPRLFSPDPEYAEKEAYILECLRLTATHPDEYVLLFLDEMGFFRWADPAPDWMSATPLPARTVQSADNNRQWRIVGVLNALSGQVNYLDNYIVGRKVLQQLYPLIVQAYPTAERIFVVEDNWSIHTHDDVLSVVKQFPQVELVWLPTYAHWLNPIEKLWRWLRQTVLHLHPYATDFQLLLGHVRAFLDQFANGSLDLLRYVGLLGDGKLASAIHLK